jgi:hypothetical protein
MLRPLQVSKGTELILLCAWDLVGKYGNVLRDKVNVTPTRKEKDRVKEEYGRCMVQKHQNTN